jgi:hypothetical protein
MGIALVVVGVVAVGLIGPRLQRVLRGLPATNQDWHYF